MLPGVTSDCDAEYILELHHEQRGTLWLHASADMLSRQLDIYINACIALTCGTLCCSKIADNYDKKIVVVQSLLCLF